MGSVGLAGAMASAQSQWIDSSSFNQWNSPGSWMGGVPQAGYTVLIQGIDEYPLTANVDADNVGVSLASLTANYADIQVSGSSINTTELSVYGGGITTASGSTLSASTATFVGSPDFEPSLSLAGNSTFANTFLFTGGNISNSGVFTANAFSLESSHSLQAFTNTGTANFNGSFTAVGAFYQATETEFYTSGLTAVTKFNAPSSPAVINNVLFEATSGATIEGMAQSFTVKQGAVLGASGATSTVNLNVGTFTNEFIDAASGVSPYGWSMVSATNGGKVTIDANSLVNTYTYNPGDTVEGLAFIEASGEGQVNLNVLGTLTNNDVIQALSNGTVNVNATTVNGSGYLNAVGTGAQLYLLGANYSGQYVTAAQSGQAFVGTTSQPLASFNSGGLIDDNYNYSVSVYGSGTTIDAYVTQFDGAAGGSFQDYLGARDGASVSLTGSTYTGSTVYAQTVYGDYPGSTATITESTSATGLGYISALALDTPSSGINQVNISAPIITFDQPEISTSPHSEVFLDASTALTLDDDGTYTAEGYYSHSTIEAQGGEILLQSPDIQITGTASNPITLQSIGSFGLLKLNATGPDGQIMITNQGASSLSTMSTISGSIELDGAEVVNGMNSYLIAGEANGTIVFNNSAAAGLDAQNQGVLGTHGGSLIVGGTSFENEASGSISISQIGGGYLGYTLASPSSAPAASSELLESTNYGMINVFGTLTSNGTLTNSGVGQILVTDSGDPNASGSYSPGLLEVTAGDFDNGASATVNGSSLTVLTGTLTNSGTLTIQDDLSSPSQAYNSLVTAENFTNSGTVTVTGSTVTVDNQLTNNGSFTLVDDPSGGAIYGNSYPDQASTLNILGNLDNSGASALLSVQNSALTGVGGGSITNEQSATLALNDSTAALPEGTLTNQTGANLTVFGSTLTIGNGAAPASVAISNSGGATLLLQNDYSAVAGGGPILFGTLTVDGGDIQNAGGVLTVLGTTLNQNAGNFYNSANGTFNVNDDLSQGGAIGALPSTVTLNQNLTNTTGGIVNVLGSQLNVLGTLTNNGASFNIMDDNSGGASFGNSYPTQYSTVTVENGNLVNEGGGSFTLTESTLQVWNGGITNQDNSTLTVQDDSSLPQPQGAMVQAYGTGITNTGTANFNVIGSTVDTNTLTNQGSATFTLTSDDSAYVSSGGTASIASGTVSADTITNSGNAYFHILGGNVVADTITNSGNAVFTVDQLADGNVSGFVDVLSGFNNGTSQTDAARVNVLNGEIYMVGSGGYFQTGANSKTYVGVDGAIYAPGVNFTLGNPGDPAGSAGYLGGSGSVFMSVVNNAGTIDPGDPQSLTIFGGLTEGANGTLAFHLDGPGGPGVGYDSLDVYGNVMLGGTLDLIIGPGFNPNGQTFDILTVTGGTITGDFSKLEETINGVTFNLPGTLNIGSGGITYEGAATPEPASWLALGGAALGVVCRRRRRRVQA